MDKGDIMNCYFLATGELLNNEIRATLGIKAEYVIDYTIKGYSNARLISGKTVLVKDQTAETNGEILAVSDKTIWAIDQWKELPIIDREIIKVKHNDDTLDVFIYTTYGESEASTKSNAFLIKDNCVDLRKSIDNYLSLKNENSSSYIDLHMLIPCSISQDSSLMNQDNDSSLLGSIFHEKINYSINNEFKGDFVKNEKRGLIGKYYFIYSYGEGTEYQFEKQQGEKTVSQACIVSYSIHQPTNLAVIDIFMPSVLASPQELMTFFCYQKFKLSDGNNSIEFEKWLESFGLEVHGTKRNVVFSSAPMETTELLNSLASESAPMGNIIGQSFIEASKNNIAQYDTAEVFLSENTFVEIFKDFRIDLPERLDYQCVELFFLELILFQDAAISRVCDHINDRIDDLKNEKSNAESLDDLVFESAYAVRFWDIDQFFFPTVRISAQKIAEGFGLPRQMEKYNQSIEILEKLISIHDSKIDETENKLLNSLLLLLTIVQVLPSFFGIVRAIISNSVTVNDIVSVLISCGVSAAILGIYVIIKKIKINKTNKRFRNK